MLDFNPQKKNCTGCSACYSICPVHCISMERDEEGFLYPTANSDQCIGCNLCEKVCPQCNEKVVEKHDKKVITAVTHDSDIWKRSASGGAFSEICRLWADDDTLIVGAAWDGLKVHHTGVLGFNNIAPLCKSKYVSSAIEDTFLEIRNHLRRGKKVIFCGCPCQVDGLRCFLRKKHENLLLIDLICHGQGSPLVFQESMNKLTKDLGEKVISYEFRAKRKVHETDYLACVKTVHRTYYLENDPYIQLFLSQNALRPSCGFNCKYRDINRTGDLTIADCKGLFKIYPHLLGTKVNYSTIVSNTQKGENLIKILSTSMKTYECSLENVIKYNPLFAKHTWASKDRENFFDDFKIDMTDAIDKWTTTYKIRPRTILHLIFENLPTFMRRIIYSVKRSIKNR